MSTSGKSLTSERHVANPDPSTPGKAGWSRWQFFLCLVILSVSMASMGSSIVMESSSFPANQWLITTCYTAGFTFLFYMTLVLYYRLPSSAIWHELTQWKQYTIIGMMWTLNYQFILLSAPYLPNTVQVVLAQFQCILIAFIDYRWMGIQLPARKWCCVGLTVLLGLGSVAFSAEASTEPTGVVIFWSCIFLVNAFAGGLAVLCTEANLKLKRDTFNDDHKTALLEMAQGEAPRFDTLKHVILLNFASNFWGMLWCLLGIPLALFSLHSPPHGADPRSAFELIDMKIFTDLRILYWVLMLFSSFFYTIASGAMVVEQSAIFSAMCSGFGTTIQLLIFLVPSLPADFVQKFDLPSFILAICVTIVACIYVATSDQRDMEKLKASTIGDYFKKAIANEPMSLRLFFCGLSVYVLSWVAIAGMIFLPKLLDGHSEAVRHGNATALAS